MNDSQLLGPDGRPVKLADLGDDGATIAHLAESDAIPTLVHGFQVEWTFGVYPLNAADSHRRACYVELFPTTVEAQRLIESKAPGGRLMAQMPLTADGVEAIVAEGSNSPLAEAVILDTLRFAVRELRKYLRVPRQSFERK